jgi:hypothetical protein
MVAFLGHGATVRSMTIARANVTVTVEGASTFDQGRLEGNLRKILGPDTTVTLKE